MQKIQRMQDYFTRLIERSAPYLITVTVLLGSLLVVSNDLYGFVSPKIFSIDIGMMLLIVCALLAYSFHNLKRIFSSRAVWGVIIFLFVCLLSTLTSIDRTLSWLSHPERGTGIFFLLVLFLGAIAISLLLQKNIKNIRKFLLYPLGITGGLVGLFTILGPTGLNFIHTQLFLEANGGGLLGNSSFAGTYVMGVFFIIFYLFATASSKKEKIILAIIGFLTVFNPVIFGYGIFHNGIHGLVSLIGDARAAVISLSLGTILLIGIFLGLSVKKNASKWFGWVLVVVVLCTTIVSLVLVSIPNTSLHNSFIKAAGGNRFVYWDAALKTAKEHPLLGSGPETFRYDFERHFNPVSFEPGYNEIWSDRPHNVFLEWLGTAGILGLVSYLAMITLTIFGAIKVYMRTKNRWFLSTIIAFIFAYIVNNFFVFDTPTSYLLFASIIAWVGAEEMQISKEVNNISKPIKASNFIFRALLSVLIVILILSTIIPEMKKTSFINKEAHSSISARSSLYETVERSSPYGSGIGFAQRADAYTMWYQNNVADIVKRSAEDKHAVLADIDALTQELKQKFTQYPVTIQGTLSLGRLASIKMVLENKLDPDALAQMKDAANQTISLSPGNPQGYWLLGQAFIYEQSYDQALINFQKALMLDVKVPQSYVAIINLAKLTNNKKLLDSAVQAFNNQFPEYKLTNQ